MPYLEYNFNSRLQPPQGTTPLMSLPAIRNSSRSVYDSDDLRLPFLFEISEFWKYRFLFWNLIMRDLKVRYKRSLLGVLWAMINPLLTMLVLVVVFSFLFKFDVDNYAIFVLSGLVIWNLFAQGTTFAMNSILENSGYLQKIYIPSSVFVTSAVGSSLVTLLFSMIPLFILAVITGVKPHFSWLLLPLPILQVTMFTLGIGSILAALVVFFNDVLHIYSVLVIMYFYLTPIIYPVSILPEQIQTLQQFNPMFHYVALFRALLMNSQIPDIRSIGLSTLAAIFILIIGWAFFTRQSDQFAYRT
jgi:ABC-type polysaccharide/polyol phosphate export permease